MNPQNIAVWCFLIFSIIVLLFAVAVLWKIYKGPDQRGHGGRHVVHGHHQFTDGPITVEGRTNLDTLAWYTGRLVVGVFNDDVAGGPVSLLEVRGEAVETSRKAQAKA